MTHFICTYLNIKEKGKSLDTECDKISRWSSPIKCWSEEWQIESKRQLKRISTRIDEEVFGITQNKKQNHKSIDCPFEINAFIVD